MKKPLDYQQYLELEKLLSLQKLSTKSHKDEMLFIVIHQSYELWFKLIIYELKFSIKAFDSNKEAQVLHQLKRIRHIIKLLIPHMDILETMLPTSFQAFRGSLGESSGLQSVQYKQMEELFGVVKPQKIISPTKTLRSSFINFYKKYASTQNIQNSNLEDILIYIYQNHSVHTEIAELVIDIDEGIQEWRYRHVKIVERIIGKNIQGTGKTSGSQYLINKLSLSFCPELWKVRTIFFTN